MSEETNSLPNQPSQESLHYQNATEVMEGARVNALAQIAVETADAITYHAGVVLPTLAVFEGEAITKQAAAEQAIPQEAEDYLAGGIGAEAEEYLKQHNERKEQSKKIKAIAEKHGLRAAIESARGEHKFSELRKETTPKGRSNLLD